MHLSGVEVSTSLFDVFNIPNRWKDDAAARNSHYERSSPKALHLLALDPIVETTADKNSYGFRQQRSCADAIEQCFKTLPDQIHSGF